jgi:hypothetical protein
VLDGTAIDNVFASLWGSLFRHAASVLADNDPARDPTGLSDGVLVPIQAAAPRSFIRSAFILCWSIIAWTSQAIRWVCDAGIALYVSNGLSY